jgi:hypothetical protein
MWEVTFIMVLMIFLRSLYSIHYNHRIIYAFILVACIYLKSNLYLRIIYAFTLKVIYIYYLCYPICSDNKMLQKKTENNCNFKLILKVEIRLINIDEKVVMCFTPTHFFTIDEKLI